MLFWFFLLLWYCLVQLCDFKKRHFLCSSNLVVKALCIKIYQCGTDGEWDLLTILDFCQALRDGNKLAQMEEAPLFPGESIKVIGECSTECCTEYYSIASLFRTEQNIISFWLLLFNLMPLKISWSDVDFFSLSFKSRCRKEKSDPEDDLFHIDNFSFPKDFLFHRGVCIVFLLGGAKDMS